MTIRIILLIISFGLLVWLFVDNVFQLDIAATKNDGLINSQKIKIDSIENIDSIKVLVKSNLDIIRQNTKRNSKLAIKRIWIILGLAFIQIAVWTLQIKKRSNSS